MPLHAHMAYRPHIRPSKMLFTDQPGYPSKTNSSHVYKHHSIASIFYYVFKFYILFFGFHDSGIGEEVLFSWLEVFLFVEKRVIKFIKSLTEESLY